MLKANEYRNIIARTALATSGDPVPVKAVCVSYVASVAVQTAIRLAN